jgi:hypothetical protein
VRPDRLSLARQVKTLGNLSAQDRQYDHASWVLLPIAKAHLADLQTQDAHDVRYLRYWVDEANGKVFCLVEAPSAEAAADVHREAHGLVADHIYRVQEGS